MKMLKVLAVLLFVAAAAPQSAFAQEAGLFGGGLGGFMPLILIFVFFYIFLLRPQQKKAKAHQQLLNNLRKDDKIVTSGGIYGTVVSVRDNIVEVKVAEGVNIQVSKPAVATVLSRPSETSSVSNVDIIKN
ncbi:MAG: preprotein translocase subunit YajC [Elusimicrobiota bacterium]|jgi:preprotein translocase subunit YajC|nr:preprotein translocase subunit YajC [Elusimicrobiota bacterium]